MSSSAAASSTASHALLNRRERKLVEMRAFAVLADGQIADMKVLDLSFDGCRVETDLRLTPGEEIKLSVLGRGAIAANVCWSDGRRAGLIFKQPARKQSPRRSERIAVTAQVRIRRSGQKAYGVNAFDVTPLGCKCEFVERPAIDEHVWLKFDGLDALEARVCWIELSAMGLQFSSPIHPAVFDLLMQRLG
jgi:hypothetical protein